jgi:WD40 repeat protein
MLSWPRWSTLLLAGAALLQLQPAGAAPSDGARIQLAHAPVALYQLPASDTVLSVTHSGTGTVQAWDMRNGKHLYAFADPGFHTTYNGAIARDGTLVIASEAQDKGAATRLTVWNGHTGSLLRTLSLPYKIKQAFISPSAKYIVAWLPDPPARPNLVRKHEVLLLDALSGATVTTMSANADGGYSSFSGAAMTPDEQLLLTSENTMLGATRLHLWRGAGGERLRTIELAGRYRLSEQSVSADGRRVVLTFNGDKTASSVVLDLGTGAAMGRHDHAGATYSGNVFTPDGRGVLTGYEDGSADLWDAASGKLAHTLSGHTRAVRSVAVSGDGRIGMTGGLDETVRRWDLASGKELVAGPAAPQPAGLPTLVASIGHTATDYVGAAAFSSDAGLLATGGAKGTLILWNVDSRMALRAFRGPVHSGRAIDSIAFSPDNTRLVSGEDGMVRVWDAGTGLQLDQFACMRFFQIHPERNRQLPVQVAFDTDSAIVASCSDGTARWDLASAVKTLLPRFDFKLPDLQAFKTEAFVQKTMAIEQSLGYRARPLALAPDG